MELWRCVRRVHTWAATDPEKRGNLFGADPRQVRGALGAACALAPHLVEAFGVFARLVNAPTKVDAGDVSAACHQVMEWAVEEGYQNMGVLFAEAAAYATPLNAGSANTAGRACRGAAMPHRAATWHEHGAGLAVRTANHQAMIDALLGSGHVQRDLGNHEEAKPYFERAARRALYTGRDRQAARAHHHLLKIAAEVGTIRQARRHVLTALAHYPVADSQLPALAHDWAYLLVRLGHFSAAIPLLARARDHAPTPAEESIVGSTLAWALGGVRNRRQYDEVEAAVTALLETHRVFASAALLHLARGAHAFGLWDRAESFATEASSTARQGRETATEQAAEELLAQLRARQLAPVDLYPPDPEEIARIQRRIEHSLRNLASRRRGRSRPGTVVAIA